jgi:predicted exporter
VTRRSTLLALWLLALGALTGWSLTQVRVASDLSQFLPDAATLDDRVLLNQVREGVAARTLLIAIGGSRAQPEIAQASRALARTLRQDRRFRHVANGDLGTIGAAELAPLFTHRYLVGPPGPCREALSAAGLHAALAERLRELTGPVPSLDRERMAADPVACFRGLLQGLTPRQGPPRAHGVWFSPQGDLALLIAQTAGDAAELAGQRDAVEGMRQAFASLPEAQGLDLELAGPGYFAVASEETIRRETLLLSVAASILVGVILWVAFRSLALVLLGMLPLLSAILVGVALVVALFGTIHGITLALGATLLGVALDYPVHVFAHTARNALGAPPADRGVWHALLLGVLTTVLGYAALAFASFRGLAQLGILSAAGLLTAALCARFLLPALMPPEYRLPPRPRLASFLARLPVRASWAPWLGLVAAAVLLAFTLVRNPQPWDSDLGRLSTVPAAEIARDRAIRHDLGAPDVTRLLYAVGPNPESVLTAIEAALPDLRRLAAAGSIRDFDAAPLWIPSTRTQQERQAELPAPTTLAAALDAASQGLPFRPAAFTPFLDDVERSRLLPPLSPADLAATPLGTRLALLLQPMGEDWIGLVPISGVSDTTGEASLRGLTAAHDLHYLDLRSASVRLLRHFLDATLNRLMPVALVIGLVLVVGLRRPRLIGRVILPIVLAIALDFSLLVLFGGAVNLFHLVSLILVFGLAIDYSLFFNRPMSDLQSLERTSLSLAVCALSTLAMFGLLALSSIPALRAIGSTVAIGIILAFVGAAALAPRRSSNLGRT